MYCILKNALASFPSFVLADFLMHINSNSIGKEEARQRRVGRSPSTEVHYKNGILYNFLTALVLNKTASGYVDLPEQMRRLAL